MSKGIRHYPEHMTEQVVNRRLRSETKGIGYWAARDYQDKKMVAMERAEEEETQTG